MINKEIIEKSLTTFSSKWNDILSEETEKDYFKDLIKKVSFSYENEIVYPPFNEVYRAFSLTSLDDLKVIIIGQDPYINENQANGLAFSVKDGVKLPPSLLNIYKELRAEYGYEIPTTGELEPWAKQGVLLLNASLTVKAHMAFSHSKIGWERFTDSVIEKIDSLDRYIVYILWGNFAQKKEKLIKSKKAFIIKCAHPSPLSANRGFFNSNCFKRCNEYLESVSLKTIDWEIM